MRKNVLFIKTVSRALSLCLLLAVSCGRDGNAYEKSIVFDDTETSVTAAQYVGQISFLPLEDTMSVSAFRSADKTIIHNGYIYIGDFGRSRIVAFDTTGRFAFSIDERGRGPQQYMELKNFTADDKNIYTIDNYLHAIFIFDARSGRFVGRKPLKFTAWDIEKLGGSNFIFAFSPLRGGITDRKQPRQRVLITDTDFDICKTFFTYGVDEHDAIGKNSFFTRTDGGIVYNYCCNDDFSVFSTDNIGEYSTVHIDFATKSVPEKYRDDFDAMNNEGYRYLYSTPIVCSCYTSLEICIGEYSECYLSADGKTVTNPLSGSFNYFNWPLCQYDGRFVSLLSGDILYDELVEDGFNRADSAIESHLRKGGSALLFYSMK